MPNYSATARITRTRPFGVPMGASFKLTAIGYPRAARSVPLAASQTF